MDALGTLRHQDSSALNYGAEVLPKCPHTSATLRHQEVSVGHFGTTEYLYRPYIVMHFVLYVARQHLTRRQIPVIRIL